MDDREKVARRIQAPPRTEIGPKALSLLEQLAALAGVLGVEEAASRLAAQSLAAVRRAEEAAERLRRRL